VLFALHAHPLLQPRGELDPVWYIELGKRVAAGDLLLAPEPFFISPLYIYFLGAVFAAGGGLLAARVAQIALGAIAVWLAGETARAVFGEKAGWIASALLALTGVVTFYEVTLLQSSLDPILVAATLYFATRARHVPAGICAGLLVLNRPNALLWLAAYGAYLLYRERAKALPFVIAAVLVIAPVTLRNWIVSRELILVSSHGGLNLLIGNNADADGTYKRLPGIRPDIRGQVTDAEKVAERASGRELTKREVSQFFTKQAFGWMREHPLDALRLFIRKLWLTFNNADLRLNHSYDFYAADPPLLLLVAGPWLLFPLAAVALPRAPKGLLTFAIVYALSVAIFFVSTRYRVPLLVAAAPLAGGGAVLLFKKWQRIVVAIAVAVLVLWDPKVERGLAIERAELVFLDIERGRVHDAIPRINDIALEHPDPPSLFLQAGMALDDAKRREDAIRMWERALLETGGERESQLSASARLVEAYIESGRRDDAMRLAKSLDPARFDAVNAAWIGEHAMNLRDLPTARAFLKRVVELRPDSAEAHHNLATVYVLGNEREPALRELEAAVRLDPQRVQSLVNLAVLQAQNGDFANARRNADRALRIRPGYEPARSLLDKLPR
jgi:Dolichyl-phosphate-mannose-protein mannosyltransferase